MMKKVTAAIVLCLMSASAFAAAPAFDRKLPITSRNRQDRPLKNDIPTRLLRKTRRIMPYGPSIRRSRKRPIMTGLPNGKPLKRYFISPATINWRQTDGTLPICKNACAVFLFI